jgi:hypothetical protein
MKTPPALVPEKMDAQAFFTDLMEDLKTDPPESHDQGVVARMKRIGLEPGKILDFKALPASIQQALQDGATDGLKAIHKRAHKLGPVTNGWMTLTRGLGYYGSDYLFRAAAALYGTGPNRPEDVIYAAAQQDGEGRNLSGANRYALTFAKDQTPPADAFWSVVLYDTDGFRAPNRLNRFSLGDRDKLKFNADGSLTIYIQHESPVADQESNWLPICERSAVHRTKLSREEFGVPTADM